MIIICTVSVLILNLGLYLSFLTKEIIFDSTFTQALHPKTILEII